ncbi:DUF5958 family protein [Spirosoma endbachense]|uniref:Uncharacterized protein n=1 Tax=Spirosoma endbachense TaxID=2666025 RepID=A0A6P1VWS5_9BACT|nr:DUF5958 family protein [Spirosoma endbachense]QHV96532.1 hypothetical protein GJR95_16590 [Spirosoma endbachense]
MSLAEEITLYQFGQGHRADGDLLDQFNQLDELKKIQRVVELFDLVQQSKPDDTDLEQALATSRLPAPALSYLVFKGHRLQRSLPISLAHAELDRSYRLLLQLFKKVYQRQLEAEKQNPANWMFWDLSNPEVVASIGTLHQQLVEEVYACAGYRSEFASLSKLNYTRKSTWLTNQEELTPEPQTHFSFLTYEEVVNRSIPMIGEPQLRAISLLCNSLNKALAKQYGLTTEQVTRLIWDVVERHMREQYNTGLFD